MMKLWKYLSVRSTPGWSNAMASPKTFIMYTHVMSCAHHFADTKEGRKRIESMEETKGLGKKQYLFAEKIKKVQRWWH